MNDSGDATKPTIIGLKRKDGNKERPIPILLDSR